MRGGGVGRGGQRVNFFITVKGQKPVPYDPNNPPAIITTQGAVEDWTIENQAPEVHEFHIHQIHFLLLAINGVPVPPEQRQFYDTFQVPYWDQVGQIPEHQGADGFPRSRGRRFRLSLPYPPARGRGHDGDHPGAAEEVSVRCVT